jgi:mono/diheme cytochrome c family protein
MQRTSQIIASAAAIFLSACGGGHVQLPDLSAALRQDTTGLRARGEYIVRNVAVCGHCHAADPEKNPDGPLSGGMAFKNWRIGTVRASNLTPENETGLGAWTEAEIVRAIRNGEDREGHLLTPVMPYEWFHDMSDADALAVAHYLKSLPPVRNAVSNDHSIAYKFAKLFFLKVKSGSPEPTPARDVNPRYGRYLANHVALCADCHTPRGGIQQKPKMDELFSGTATPPDGFPANPANLTPDKRTGIGEWSEADFMRTIRTGTDPDGHKLHRFMPYEYVRRMTDNDLRAIYSYLMALPPIVNKVPHKHADDHH